MCIRDRLITPCVKRRGVISNTGRRGSGFEVKVFISFELSGSIFTESSLKTLETMPVSYTHLRAHETVLDLVCRLLLEKKKKN